MDTALGPVVTADEVCQAVQATLEAWMPTALAAFAAALDEPELDAPHDYEQVPTVDALTSADLPSVGILTPGLAAPPVRDEDGNLQCTWRVNVVAFIRGDDYAVTQHNTRLYAAAIATILTQQHTLLGFAAGTRLVAEDYEPITAGARTLGGALVSVDVTVDDARNDLAVLDGPPPITPDTVVAEVGVDVATEA